MFVLAFKVKQSVCICKIIESKESCMRSMIDQGVGDKAWGVKLGGLIAADAVMLITMSFPLALQTSFSYTL